jgi:hypothetical protein
VNKFKVEVINFMDDTFRDNVERVGGLCDLIKKTT